MISVFKTLVVLALSAAFLGMFSGERAAVAASVACQRSDGVIVSDSYCNGQALPAGSSSCDGFVGPVVCQRSDGVAVADSLCPGAKPAASCGGGGTGGGGMTWQFMGQTGQGPGGCGTAPEGTWGGRVGTACTAPEFSGIDGCNAWYIAGASEQIYAVQCLQPPSAYTYSWEFTTSFWCYDPGVVARGARCKRDQDGMTLSSDHCTLPYYAPPDESPGFGDGLPYVRFQGAAGGGTAGTLFRDVPLSVCPVDTSPTD